MKRVSRIESAVNNEVSGGGEAGLWAVTWSSLLQEELLNIAHNMKSTWGGSAMFSTCTHSRGSGALAQANFVIILDLDTHQNWQTLSDAKEKKNGQKEVQL